jgi:hypothetical protein
MKTVKRLYNYNRETGERSVKDVEFDMVDASGVLLEEGQKVWYARASKSAPAQLFRAEIVKLTTSSVCLEYAETHWDARETVETARLTSGFSNTKKGNYEFRQIAVIQ